MMIIELAKCSICWTGHCRRRVIFIRSRSVSLMVQFILFVISYRPLIPGISQGVIWPFINTFKDGAVYTFCYLLSSFDTWNQPGRDMDFQIFLRVGQFILFVISLIHAAARIKKSVTWPFKYFLGWISVNSFQGRSVYWQTATVCQLEIIGRPFKKYVRVTAIF